MADLTPLCDEVLGKRRLFLASNRGPVEHLLTPDGVPEGKRGSGGVVTAFNCLTQLANFTWVASAMGEGDRAVSRNGSAPSIQSPIPGHKIDLRYVVTQRRVYHKYYNVLCNPLLWFLQHYMWNPPYNPNIDANVHDAWETGYIPVNQAFAKAIVEEARNSSLPPVILGHDYHLYLLPEFLRSELPAAIIQHYVHIPWPAARYWQMIPNYIVKRICSSLCRTDIVGFQSPQDCRSFLDTVEEFLPKASVDRNAGSVVWQDQTTQVKSYPLSINVAEVQGMASSPRALEYETRLAEQCNEMTVVRIDRAEPNRNIVRGFKAFGLLLSRYPELRGRVNFLAFLVPSRTHIRQYQRYMDEIHQTVTHVNQTYGTDSWQPIQTFIENNYTQAVAGMKLYDALLVNTIIEGMNLVAKEGPLVNNRDGVLVLSETSGSHHQLSRGAISISPTDVEGTMDALYRAITMAPEKRREMSAFLADAVTREDIVHWISSQLEDLAKLM